MKITFGLIYVAFLIAAIVGWVMNIVAIVGSNFDHITGLLLMRVIGVFVAPVGSILGLFF